MVHNAEYNAAGWNLWSTQRSNLARKRIKVTLKTRYFFKAS